MASLTPSRFVSSPGTPSNDEQSVKRARISTTTSSYNGSPQQQRQQPALNSSSASSASASVVPLLSVSKIPHALSPIEVPSTTATTWTSTKAAVRSTLSWGLVCACNINRSMTAHDNLLKAGYPSSLLRSYGSWDSVRLPAYIGGAIAFDFGTPYEHMCAKLNQSGPGAPQWMRETGMQAMLERDASVKRSPDRWQDLPISALTPKQDTIYSHDIVVCFDSQVYRLVAEDLLSKGLTPVGGQVNNFDSSQQKGRIVGATEGARSIQLVLLHTRDTIEDARAAGRHSVDFAETLCPAVAQALDNEDALESKSGFTRASAKIVSSIPAGDNEDEEDSIESPLSTVTPAKAPSTSRMSLGDDEADETKTRRMPKNLAALTRKALHELAVRLRLPEGCVHHTEFQ